MCLISANILNPWHESDSYIHPPHLFKCGGMSPVAARERAGILKRKHVQAVHSDSQGGCVTRASRSLPPVSLQEKGNKIAHVNSQVAKAHRAYLSPPKPKSKKSPRSSAKTPSTNATPATNAESGMAWDSFEQPERTHKAQLHT